MRKIKEVLRLKWDRKLTNRQIATSCSISHSTVREAERWFQNDSINDIKG